MSPTATIEDRLAAYRPALDAAIAERSANPLLRGPAVVELDFEPASPSRRPARTTLLVGAAGIVMIAGLTTLVTLRDEPGITPSSPGTSTPPLVATTVDDAVPPITQATAVPEGTAPATTAEGSGTTPACPAETGTVPAGTLYLGGPPSEQNLAAAGFIYSLPSGRTALDVAMKTVAMPVIGLECGISATPTADPNVALVTVEPPATPQTLQLTVTVVERDGAIGAIAIGGTTQFEADATNLRLGSGVPAAAARVQVRFKKGEDVWELTAEPTSDVDIALAVPNGETDRFPDEPIDWVLFTILDAQYRVLDAGGDLTAE